MGLSVLVLIVLLLAAFPAILFGRNLIGSIGPDGASTASPTTIGVALLLLSVRMRFERVAS